MDYILPETTTVTFPTFGVVTRCLTITIAQDEILESIEVFTVSITTNDSSVLLPDPIGVGIIDSSRELWFHYWHKLATP